MNEWHSDDRPDSSMNPAVTDKTMDIRIARYGLLIGTMICVQGLLAQRISSAADQPWHSREEGDLQKQAVADQQPGWAIDHDKTYTLSELIDLAELHNPETRSAWERARIRAEELGIARSQYFPTIVASVSAVSLRQPALIGEYLHRQTIASFSPTLHVEYLIFDVGGRSGALDVAKANLLIQDLEFNDTHRRLIYQVASAYFRLLSAKGQREAAVISLQNAEMVEADAQSRLGSGLATRPDVLEATAARAQADYDLQATVGGEAIAKGALATAMGLPPETQFHVISISDIPLPTSAADSVTEEIERALQQRPDLLATFERIRSAEGSLKQAKSAYFPSIHFAGDGGLARGYAQQDLYPGHYGEGEVWSAGLSMKWTLFDGAGREKRIAADRAEKSAAEADLLAIRDEVEQEVFTSYTDMQTALRQQRSAAALLTASLQSYDAARESYGLGLRSQLDVISAQKTLATARSQEVVARAQLLFEVADLAFRTGDMIQVQARAQTP
jgi:outer membrane protein